MKKAIPAIILGFLSLATGSVGYGGYILGIPALILGILAARETGAPRVIGLIAIGFGCMGIVEATAVLMVVKPPEKVTEPYHPYHIYGTAGTEVAVENWGVIVTPPIYTGTFYEKYYGDNYYVYKSRRGYHFALVKIRAINRGKEEDQPFFVDIKLVTKEGLRYKEKSGFNYSIETLKSPPPLFKEFDILEDVLPREECKGYFFFQIPEDAIVEDLFFKYRATYIPPSTPSKVWINLLPPAL